MAAQRVAVRSVTPKPAGRSKTFRPDIQGLRAFAVLAVVFEHLTGRPQGGFVGVDIFFVISGFLITGILAREFSRSGTISFGGFYRRRVKRIFPAATLTLVASVVIGALLLTHEKATATFWDAVAAFFFVSNWRFAATGTDYFAGGGLPSPVQQFWSLSVEEQFYFVWPWVMLGVLALGTTFLRKSRNEALRLAFGVLVTIVVLSFILAVVESATTATVAYFSSLTRAWELGVGGAIALMAHKFEHIPPVLRVFIAWLGVAGLVFSVLFVSSSQLFPGPGAAWPVLATALVIVASIGTPARFNFLLVNPVARFFGDISYSLYLWHFPTIIFLAVIIPSQGHAYMVIALLVSVALATTMYYSFERPLHKSPWLDRYESPKSKRDAWQAWWRRDKTSIIAWGSAGMIIVAAVGAGSAGYVTVSTNAQRSLIAEVVAAQSTAEAAFAELDGTQLLAGQRISENLRQALHATTWPALSPSIDEVMTDGKVGLRGCHPSVPSDPSTCAFGNPAAEQLIVYGDSLGITLLPTVIGAFGDDYFIRGLTRAACPMIPLAVSYADSTTREGCETQQAASIKYINATHPKAVFIIENYEWANRLVSAATGAALQREWTDAAEAFTISIATSGASVIFVTPPSMGKQIVDCATALSLPADCVSHVDATWPLLRDAESTVDGAQLVDTLHWYCTDAGYCPAFSAGIITKRDYVHPTVQYAESVNVVNDFRDLTSAIIH